MSRTHASAWQEYGLQALAVMSFVFLVAYALTRVGKKGTTTVDIRNLWAKPVAHVAKKPRGSSSTGEEISRQYLEERFGVAFAKARPDFLKNPVNGGHNLELDCFNNELGLALEYNGAQHYKYTPHFHANKEAFLNQKYRDEMKRNMCKENNITLVEVPYTVRHDDIPDFIESKLQEFGF